MSRNYPPGYFSTDPRDHQWTDEELEEWQEAETERRIDAYEYDQAMTGRAFPY